MWSMHNQENSSRTWNWLKHNSRRGLLSDGDNISEGLGNELLVGCCILVLIYVAVIGVSIRKKHIIPETEGVKNSVQLIHKSNRPNQSFSPTQLYRE